MFPFRDNPDRLAEQQRQQEQSLMREQIAAQSAEGISDHVLLNQKKEREDLLRWQQDLADELELLKHKLRREIINENGEWVSQKICVGIDQEGNRHYEELPPYMNEIGIAMVETVVSPLLSRNMINTNIDEQRVLDMLKRTCNDLVSNIAYFGETHYDMEFGDYSTVVRIIKNMIIPAPFKAISGWYKKMDSTVHKSSEIFSNSPAPLPRKKFLGVF